MRTLLIVAGIAAATALPAEAQTAGVKASTNRTTASTFSSTTRSAAGDNAVSAPAATASTTSSVASGNAVQVQNVSGNPLGPTTQGESAFRPGGPFSNDSGNSALGTSAGQSSSGTAPGNSSNGIGPDGLPLPTNPDGTNNPVANPTVVGTGSFAPEGNASFGGANRQAITTIAVPVQSTPTPLFDQAARDGRAREQARRARGDEPRVYGIAPNTERDLTWQMPDDRIIRY